MRMRDELHIIISSDIANFSPSIYFHFSCSLTVAEGGGRRNVPMPCLVCFIKKDELQEDARRAPHEGEGIKVSPNQHQRVQFSASHPAQF